MYLVRTAPLAKEQDQGEILYLHACGGAPREEGSVLGAGGEMSLKHTPRVWCTSMLVLVRMAERDTLHVRMALAGAGARHLARGPLETVLGGGGPMLSCANFRLAFTPGWYM